MSLSIGQVRRWSAPGLERTGAAQRSRAQTLLGFQDELDGAGVHPAGWKGEGATAAARRRDDIAADLRRMVAGVEAVRTAVWAAGDAVISVHRALRETIARDTAPVLAGFLNGIDASRTSDPNLTTLAHSYGSMTASYAMQEGTGVDNAVFYGSPGLGEGIGDGRDLPVPEGHVFVVEATWDPVADLAAFGRDPNHVSGVTGLSTDAGTSPDGVARAGSSGHSEYTVDETMSQYNLAVVTGGMPELAVQGRNLGVGDVLRYGFPS